MNTKSTFKTKGKALKVIKKELFKNGKILLASDLNKIIFAIRALERKINKV